MNTSKKNFVAIVGVILLVTAATFSSFGFAHVSGNATQIAAEEVPPPIPPVA